MASEQRQGWGAPAPHAPRAAPQAVIRHDLSMNRVPPRRVVGGVSTVATAHSWTGLPAPGTARDGRSAAAPDEELIAALMRDHGGALLAHVRRRVGDASRAEDIVQEVMLRAWRHADRLDPGGGSLRPWLFTTADHLATDAHRARRARPPEVGGAALDGCTVADATDRAADALDVAGALRALTPEHRSVLVETYYLGRTVAEAAAVLGIPVGTVKSRSYYALRALRLALEERGWHG